MPRPRTHRGLAIFGSNVPARVRVRNYCLTYNSVAQDDVLMAPRHDIFSAVLSESGDSLLLARSVYGSSHTCWNPGTEIVRTHYFLTGAIIIKIYTGRHHGLRRACHEIQSSDSNLGCERYFSSSRALQHRSACLSLSCCDIFSERTRQT